jgi:hypothetical protein
MPDSATEGMAKQRALLTDTEREILSGEREVKDNYLYSVQSRVRTRIKGPLKDDIETLREHDPELFEEIERTVLGLGEADDIAGGDSSSTEQPAVDAEQSADTDPQTPKGSAGSTVEQAGSGPSSRVRAIVDDVAAGWDDDHRLENRRGAAETVLQHAVDTGEPVGKSSEIVDEVQEQYPVEGQNEDTYWRKNLRAVLSEVGDYSNATGGYTVSLDEDGESSQ